IGSRGRSPGSRWISALCSECGTSTRPFTRGRRLRCRPAPLREPLQSRCGPDKNNGERVVQRIEPIILVAAVGFYALAMTSQGVLPYLEKKVTRPGGVKTIAGVTIPAARRTELEDLGRHVYIREGCWYCHSQFVWPVNRDTDKWGPVSQAGEMIYALPHTLGTRRIAPDLAREGNRRSAAWHFAHFWNPRATPPGSIMPALDCLSDTD